MDLTMLSLLLVAITIFVSYFINCYSYWSRRGIPSAKGVVPLFGHMLPVVLLQENVPMVCEKVYNLYKNCSMVGFYKFTTPVLLVRDPELVKTVLQTNFTSFHANGRPIDAERDPLLAKNPFFCYGDNWLAGRKRLTYAFSSMRLKILFESVNQVCTKFHGYIDKKLKGNDKYEVELKPLLSKFTGEVVANAGLGIEGFCFEDKSDAKSFDAIGRSLFEPSAKTGIKQLLILVLPFMGKILGVKFVPDEIDNFFRNTITSILERRNKESTRRNDFLQLMADLEKTQGEELDVDTVTAHTFSFFVDGFETSSITLSFVIFQLATHLDVQKKLREEIMQELSKNDGVLTYEALREMTYMDQVISESQRCYSAASSISKMCTEEFELKGSDGLTLRIKPGTEIEICIQALQKDPAYWTDPEIFDPDRFGPGRKNDITKYAFLPFGEGPRMCVGMRMALLQMKACLATLLRYYKVELSSKTKVPLKISGKYFLTAPEGGIWVNIKRI